MTHHDENTLSPAPQKKDLVKTAKDFLGNAFGGKNTDLNTVIEEFTSEMTLVAEGLSEDQDRISKQNDLICAQQTAFEEETLRRFHDASVDVSELKERLDVLQDKMDKMQKLQEKKHKKAEGLSGILRQATFLAAIVCGAWIITTLINFFK